MLSLFKNHTKNFKLLEYSYLLALHVIIVFYNGFGTKFLQLHGYFFFHSNKLKFFKARNLPRCKKKKKLTPVRNTIYMKQLIAVRN